MLGNKPHLARRMATRFDHEMRTDRTTKLGKRIGQCARRVVLADEADKDTVSAERADIASNVAGAADLDLAARHRQHRRRRLRRNAAHFAIDEIVEHEIADAEHSLLRYKLQRFLKIEHDCYRRAPKRHDRAQRYRSARSR